MPPFGNEDNLRQMLKLQMSVNLESVAKPGNMAQRTFDVVTWADEQGRVSELVQRRLCSRIPKTPNCNLLPRPAEAGTSKPLRQPKHRRTRAWNSTALPTPRCSSGARQLTAELVTYLKDHRFLAVVGASGSGKSSVVRAGVVPALQKGEIVKGSDKWAVHIVTPTARPLTTLAADADKGQRVCDGPGHVDGRHGQRPAQP